MDIKCYNCGEAFSLETNEKIGRHDECNKCGKGLRCCRMCVHYDITSYNECKELLAERQLDKEKVNFCDHFRPTGTAFNQTNTKDDLLKQAESLFKK